MEIFSKFEQGRENHTYQRIDPDYKVNVFLGYNDDGNMSMIITEDGSDEKVSSSKLIDVKLKRRSDQKLALSFDLLDMHYAPMFVMFCKDVIIVCEESGKDKAIKNAVVRWKYWKELFGKKHSQLLDRLEIKGLIGELYVLDSLFARKYGYKTAVSSWMGPAMGHKDYEIGDTWYEIKTINDGANQFIVSSIEQLDSDYSGHIIVVRVDETSEINESATNLNKIIYSIVDEIEDIEVLNLFRNKLSNVGYFSDPYYDDFNYIIKGSDMYLVNDDFPRIKRDAVSSSIGNAKYTILLAGIASFKEEGL